MHSLQCEVQLYKVYIPDRVSRAEAEHRTVSRLEPMYPRSRSLPHLSRLDQSSQSNALPHFPIPCPTVLANGQPHGLKIVSNASSTLPKSKTAPKGFAMCPPTLFNLLRPKLPTVG